MRRRWATWSTTPAAWPAPRASATTTSWARTACTSSPKAPTWRRGSCSPPAGSGDWPAWPRRWRSATAPSRCACWRQGCACSRRTRTPSGSSPCAGMGPPTGWPSPAGRDGVVPRLRAPGRRRRRGPLPRAGPRLLLGHRRRGRAGAPHLRRRGTAGHAPAGAAAPPRRLRPLRPGHPRPGVFRSGSGPQAQRGSARVNARHRSNDKEVN